MVGPSLSDDEQRDANRRIKALSVLFVGGSTGLVAFQAGGSATEIAASVAVGLVAGLFLLWFTLRTLGELTPDRSRDRRRRER
ncbi:hypothetical protein [Halobaculum sp. P14]|uniref:hypothetical protein n=1 Tax=Halobaculum sp. P14 TaxID=3421638 RepID=UPI003EBC649E